jgi:hypothetical protein
MGMLCRVVTGIAGGVLGAGAMVAMQFPLRAWLRRTSTPGTLADSGLGFQGTYRLPDPSAITAQRYIWRSHFPHEHPLASALIVHAGFGVSAGIIYGCFVPDGVVFTLPFALVLWVGATEVMLPALGLTKTARRSSVQIQAFGLGEHILYAYVLHQTRRVCAESAAAQRTN